MIKKLLLTVLTALTLATPAVAQDAGNWLGVYTLTVDQDLIPNAESPFDEITNFPIWVVNTDTVKVIPPAVLAELKADGSDLKITPSWDTSRILPRNIINFDRAAGTIEMVFKAPSLNKSQNSFYLYYGNPDTAINNSTLAYGEDALGVYHFEEDPTQGYAHDYSGNLNFLLASKKDSLIPDDNWAFTDTFTIASSAIDADSTLYNVPLVIDQRLIPNLPYFAKGDGSDIKVTTLNNTLLPRQSFVDRDEGTAEVWFEAPEVSLPIRTFIIHYGNPDATIANDDVFNYFYQTVYHFNDDPSAGTLTDASGNGIDATTSDVGQGFEEWIPSDVSKSFGKIGKGWRYNNQGDYIDNAKRTIIPTGNGQLAPNGSFTISAWMYHSVDDSTNAIIQTNNFGFFTHESTTNPRPIYKPDNITWTPNPLPAFQWIHATIVFDSTNDVIDFYYNGQKQTPTGAVAYTSDWTLDTTSNALGLFNSPTFSTRHQFDGYIDETHIQMGVRGPAWILVQYNNQNNQNTFWSGTQSSDTVRPTITNAAQVSGDNNSATVTFSEPMDLTSVTTAGNYSVVPDLGSINVISITSTQVRLDFADNFINGTEYTITVNGVEDENGNPILANSQIPFTASVIVAAQGPEFDFAAWQNTWTIWFDFDAPTLDTSITENADKFYFYGWVGGEWVLQNGQGNTINAPNDYYTQSRFSYTNDLYYMLAISPGTIVYDTGEVQPDSLLYVFAEGTPTAQAPPQPLGQSIISGGPDTSPPFIISSDVQDSLTFTVDFSEPLSEAPAINTSNWTVYITSLTSSTPSTVSNITYSSQRATVTMASEITPDIEYTAEIVNIEDTLGNTAGTLTTTFTRPPPTTQSTVVISSVLSSSVNGDPVTLGGSGFGTHDLNLPPTKSLGPNGWIDNQTTGVDIDQLGVTGWVPGENDMDAQLGATTVLTGTQSIDASIDKVSEGNIWQKLATYRHSAAFEKIYASFWIYMQPISNMANSANYKMLFVAPEKDAGGVHHSVCGSFTIQGAVSASGMHSFYSNLNCCEQGCDPALCWANIVPDPFYTESAFQYAHHTQGNTDPNYRPFNEVAPSFGIWQRYEIFMERSTNDQFNGGYKFYVTKPGQPRTLIENWSGIQTHDSACISVDGVTGDQPWEYFALHGLVDDVGDGSSQEVIDIFYDDVYLQFNTQARVELGDQPIYDNCTEIYAQRPTSWTASSVEFELNYGAFTAGETVYAFVIDSNGNASDGEAITLGTAIDTRNAEITSVSGTIESGSTVTISGNGFENHTQAIAPQAVGPNGWIETNSVGTDFNNLTNATGWDIGDSSSPPIISSTRAYSGNQSALAPIDAVADPTSWQSNMRYHRPESFKDIYVSFMLYWEPISASTATATQWKMWRINDTGVTSDRTGEFLATSRYNGIDGSYDTYQAMFLCALDCASLPWDYCSEEMYSTFGYTPLNSNPANYRYLNRGGNLAWTTTMPTPGQWDRVEMYIERSDIDQSNGTATYWISKPGSSRLKIDELKGIRSRLSATDCRNPSDPWEYFQFQNYFDDFPDSLNNTFGGEQVNFYYDDIYIQFGTDARVELGNNPVFENCTKLEVQPILNWSPTSIDIDFNVGTFTNGQTAYLFVINDSGVISDGKAVTIGSEPTITSAYTTGLDGDTSTINGTNFGPGPDSIAPHGVGPTGWIETNAGGTSIVNMSNATGWELGYSSPLPENEPKILIDSGAYSGTKVMDASWDYAVDGVYQRPFIFRHDTNFQEVYISAMMYIDPHVWRTASSGVKWLWVGPYNHHASCGAVSFVGYFGDNGEFRNFYNECYGYRGNAVGTYAPPFESTQPTTDFGTTLHRVVPDPYHLPGNVSSNPQYYGFFHDIEDYPNGPWTFDANSPNAGEWQRVELRLKHSDTDQYNGELEMHIHHKPGGGRRQIEKWTGWGTHSTGCSIGPPPGTGGSNPWTIVGIHNYMRDIGAAPTVDDAIDYKWDDIYIQFGNEARIELGDQPVFENCTNLEIQPTENWTDTSVSFTLNHGTFTAGQTVYLFVIDDNGKASAGEAITLTAPTDPAITTVDGTATDGNTVVINGSQFGQHSLNIAPSGVGPNGWIEQSPVGTDFTGEDPTLNSAARKDRLGNYLTGEVGTNGEWNYIHSGNYAPWINSNKVRTGTKSLDCSINQVDNPVSDESRGIEYVSNTEFDEFYTTFYVSWEPYYDNCLIAGETRQWKQWYIGTAADNYHTVCSGTSFTSKYNEWPDVEGSKYFLQKHQLCCLGMTQTTYRGYYVNWSTDGWPWFEVQSEFDYPLNPTINLRRILNRNGTLSDDQVIQESDGSWARIEIWSKNSTPGEWDGEFEYSIQKQGQPRLLVDDMSHIMTRHPDCAEGGGNSTGAWSWNRWGIHNNIFCQESQGNGDLKQYLYYDDIYMQMGPNSKARVELGDQAVYANCTKLEIQPILDWTSSRIEVDFNQATFTQGQTAYLYVIGGNGVVSSSKQITIGPPTITGVSGLWSDGETITITGDGLGTNNSSTEWMGDWIESTADGTNPNTKDSWDYYKADYTSVGSISSARAWSGGKSMLLETDAEDKTCGSSGCYQAYLRYTAPASFSDLYVSYWVYTDIVDWDPAGSVQLKYISVDCTVGCSTSTVRDHWHWGQYVDGSGNWYQNEIAAFGYQGCVTNTYEYAFSQATANGYEMPSQPYFRYRVTRGANDFDEIDLYHEDIGGWSKVEVVANSGTADGFDGSLRIKVFHPGSVPGIGMDLDNVGFLTDQACGTVAPDQWRNFNFQLYFEDNGQEYTTEHARFYIDDVFIQTGSQQRVELANSSVYENATITEIQPHTSWNGNITITCNTGQWTSGTTLYLYVINDDGEPSTGYPITLE